MFFGFQNISTHVCDGTRATASFQSMLADTLRWHVLRMGAVEQATSPTDTHMQGPKRKKCKEL
jgi:hypothetical protein